MDILLVTGVQTFVADVEGELFEAKFSAQQTMDIIIRIVCRKFDADCFLAHKVIASGRKNKTLLER